MANSNSSSQATAETLLSQAGGVLINRLIKLERSEGVLGLMENVYGQSKAHELASLLGHLFAKNSKLGIRWSDANGIEKDAGKLWLSLNASQIAADATAEDIAG